MSHVSKLCRAPSNSMRLLVKDETPFLLDNLKSELPVYRKLLKRTGERNAHVKHVLPGI